MAGNKPLTVTLITTGTCEIVASQAGNDTYAAAANVVVDFTVNASPDAPDHIFLPRVTQP